jgi:hypothetical protein
VTFYLAEESETGSCLEAKLLEIEGVKAAESGDVMSSIDYFNKSIDTEPSRPSGYNNRAQAFRLINDKTGQSTTINVHDFC